MEQKAENRKSLESRKKEEDKFSKLGLKVCLSALWTTPRGKNPLALQSAAFIA